MSYILDALKKSEQERGHGTAPSVQTLHTSGLGYHTSKTHMWPYLLLGAVFINLAALVYFIVADSQQDQAARPHNELEMNAAPDTRFARSTASSTFVPTQTTAPARESAALVDEETVYRPVSIPAMPALQAARAPAPAVSVAPPPQQIVMSQNPIIERDELPADIQQHIPIMEFSAHVYSSNPMHRSIVINGRFMEEGDRLASDLTLSEITPKGAIFDFQGHLFHQSVVSAWN